MKLTGKKVVNLAKKELGNKYHKYCKAFGKKTSWCQIFIWWILFYKGGMTYIRDSYARHAAKWCKARWKHVKMKDARAGDIVFFTSQGPGQNKCKGLVNHCGIIRKKGTTKKCYTIEGNVGKPGHWRTNTVDTRTRDKSFVWGIFRPDYK